jgi:hypothetical protein
MTTSKATDEALPLIGEVRFHQELGLWVTVVATPSDWPSTGVRVSLSNGDTLAAFVADLTTAP